MNLQAEENTVPDSLEHLLVELIEVTPSGRSAAELGQLGLEASSVNACMFAEKSN